MAVLDVLARWPLNAATPRIRYELVLEARCELAEADMRLKRAVKRLGRSYGLRCVHLALVADAAKVVAP